MPRLELPKLIVDVVSTTLARSRPALINRDPGPGQDDIPRDGVVAFELVDTGPDGIDLGATRVWIAGTLALDGAEPLAVQPAFGGPRAEVVQAAGLRVVLDPRLPFDSEVNVEVRVVSATVGGVSALDETYAFTIEDRTAPRLVAAQAMGPRTVRMAFDEVVVVADSGGFSFSPLDVPAVPIAPVAADSSSHIVTVQLDTEMTPDVRYAVALSGVLDASGNAALPPYNRGVFAGFRPARPANRHFDLWSMLPKHNRRQDDTGDLKRFIACLQEITDLLLAELDRFPDIFDLERAPSAFLDLILRDLGNPFSFDLDELGKRRLASVLVELYRQKGTAPGIRNVIRFFLGVDVAAIAAYSGDALVLGESELGDDWVLGPSQRFARYAFDVVVAVVLTETQRLQLRAIVEYMKPAHTHFVDLVEPTPPLAFAHWELGVSELGTTSELH